tara:strand:- start:841 stop:1521 length:681 start_codon:yes stop_codon:yes gene_type:complete
MMVSSPNYQTQQIDPEPTIDEALALKNAVDAAGRFRSLPSGTVFCRGKPLFRTQLARDLGSVLDVDPEVEGWECLPCAVPVPENDSGPGFHVPDFRVFKSDGGTSLLVAAPSMPVGSKPGYPQNDEVCSEPCFWISETEIRTEPRLSNAKELLRYAGVEVLLSDRIQFLSMLDENGPTPLSECLRGCRGRTDPIAMIAVLTLRRFISMDIDEAPIGPETVIRCFSI